MSTSKLEISLASGEHKKLNSLVGEWNGQTKTWFEDGDPIDDSPMSGTIRALFDGRFVQHEYKGSFEGTPFEGIAIYGYHMKTGTFNVHGWTLFTWVPVLCFRKAKRQENFMKYWGIMKLPRKIRNCGVGVQR